MPKYMGYIKIKKNWAKKLKYKINIKTKRLKPIDPKKQKEIREEAKRITKVGLTN